MEPGPKITRYAGRSQTKGCMSPSIERNRRYLIRFVRIPRHASQLQFNSDWGGLRRMATSASSSVSQRWDTAYEWKVVLLLGLGFGLVGMDRFVIGPLWNTIAADLGLNPAAIGTLAGLTAVAWGTFAIVFGRLADKWGHRKILIWSIVGFSLLGGVSGLATGMT